MHYYLQESKSVDFLTLKGMLWVFIDLVSGLTVWVKAVLSGAFLLRPDPLPAVPVYFCRLCLVIPKSYAVPDNRLG